MKKLLFEASLIILFVLLGIGSNSVFAKGQQCTVRISADEEQIDLKDVVIDIYIADLYDLDYENGTYVYAETFFKSTSPNENGIVIFERPSEAFSVDVKPETLPKGYGVPVKTFFFDGEKDEYDFKLAKISKVDVETDYSDPLAKHWFYDKVICYDTDSQPLVADTKITGKKIHLLNTSCIDNDSERDLYLYYEYSIYASGKNYEVAGQHTLHCRSRLEKAEYLKKLGLLSKHEYMNELAWSLLYADEYMDSDYLGECGTYKLGLLSTYRDNHNEVDVDYTLIDRALGRKDADKNTDNDSNIGNSKSWTYVDSSSGKFRVYYDTGSSITSSMASSVASVFDTVDAFFCTALGYSRPFNPSSSKFDIKIVNMSDVALMDPNYGSPFIKLNIDTATHIANLTGITGFSNAYTGIAAHEYFHAIMYKLGISTSESWMHECFASWAGMAYTSDYAAYRRDQILTFLNTPTLSLTDLSVTNRIYGTCVFPLYIQKTLGYAAIKKIITSYTSSIGALGAVSNGLNYYSSNLSDAFKGCAGWNYDTDYYYQMSVSGTAYSWGGADSTQVTPSAYPYSSTGTMLPGLAGKYIDFIGPSISKKLTVTIDFTNAYGGPAYGIKVLRTVNSGEHYNINATISSGRCTIIQNSFGDNIAKKITIIPMNVSSSGWMAISVNAALS